MDKVANVGKYNTYKYNTYTNLSGELKFC